MSTDVTSIVTLDPSKDNSVSIVDRVTKDLVREKAELGMEFIIAYQSGDMSRAFEIDARMNEITNQLYSIHPKWNT